MKYRVEVMVLRLIAYLSEGLRHEVKISLTDMCMSDYSFRFCTPHFPGSYTF